MSRESLQTIIVWTVSLLLFAATVVRVSGRGGPLLRKPGTFVDHASPGAAEVRKVILLLPRVEPLIPRGEVVTVFRPMDGRSHNDHDNYLAAVGLLPHHQVIPPFSAFHETPPEHLAEWVVAIGEPFVHPHYRVVAGFPEGWLYRVAR
ncbi:MAG TPA: hypothetical protein VNA04_12610 [Thermoanaerobaculia bacterium]|nr:hypothetical protein [Thermoanaerobaculia bacterium]